MRCHVVYDNVATMRETKDKRNRKQARSMTFEQEMDQWLQEQADLRGWTVSEFARQVFGCYQTYGPEIDRICPALSCPERAA